MRQQNRQGHQLGRFVRGITKHAALIAGALFSAKAARGTDALGDFRRLLGYEDLHAHTVSIESFRRIGATDVADCLTYNRFIIDVCGRRDFAGENNHILFTENLAGNSGLRVAGQMSVED
jgi:hypothetical protein